VDPAIAAVLRASLALLFAVAAGHKARDLARFRAILAEYRLLPAAATWPVAILVPAAELVTAGALTVSAGDAGPLSAAGMLALYTAAIVINLARGRREIDCGCAGPLRRQTLGGWLVVRNGALLAAAIGCLAPTAARPLLWMDVVTVAGAVAGLAALYGAIERIMASAPGLARLRAERT